MLLESVIRAKNRAPEKKPADRSNAARLGRSREKKVHKALCSDRAPRVGTAQIQKIRSCNAGHSALSHRGLREIERRRCTPHSALTGRVGTAQILKMKSCNAGHIARVVQRAPPRPQNFSGNSSVLGRSAAAAPGRNRIPGTLRESRLEEEIESLAEEVHAPRGSWRMEAAAAEDGEVAG